jgi:predicted AAA+ superfamily ATPase
MLHQVSIAKLFADVSQQTISNWIHALKTLEVLRLAAPTPTGFTERFAV